MYLIGFVLDWLRSREWRQTIVLFPVLAGCVGLLLVNFWSAANHDALASRYLRYGQQSLGNDDKLLLSSGQTTDAISPFTEAVFKKAIELDENNSFSKYVVAATLGQKGAYQEAAERMRELAPASSQGYEQAHIWMAHFLLAKNDPADFTELMHHLEIAKESKTVPAELLAWAASLALRQRKSEEAKELLHRAAQIDNKYQADLFQLSLGLGDETTARIAALSAIPRLQKLVANDAAGIPQQINLTAMLLFQGEAKSALRLLAGALNSTVNQEDRKQLLRALSETYRVLFNQSMRQTNGAWQWNIALLDKAFRADPTNPKVSETVAKIARLGGARPPEELISQLRANLAEGKATPITHAWLAEAMLMRNNFDQAIVHLKQVVKSLPGAVQSRNNLAYALALQERELDEALQHAHVAVKNYPEVAQFRDTLGFVLLKRKEFDQAAAEFEKAIAISDKPSYHGHAADAYRALGMLELAEAHQRHSPPPELQTRN